MKKKIIWRLANRPTSNEIIELMKSGLLTKDEAREILLTEETEEKVSEDSLKSEIKFLRELVEKLSPNNFKSVVETIRYIEKPYKQYGWYSPYNAWCGSGITFLATAGSTAVTNTTSTMSGTLTSGTGATASPSFSSINTF